MLLAITLPFPSPYFLVLKPEVFPCKHCMEHLSKPFPSSISTIVTIFSCLILCWSLRFGIPVTFCTPFHILHNVSTWYWIGRAIRSWIKYSILFGKTASNAGQPKQRRMPPPGSWYRGCLSLQGSGFCCSLHIQAVTVLHFPTSFSGNESHFRNND